MRFQDIKDILNGNAPTNGSTAMELAAFCDSELALLAKKNASKVSDTPTPKQLANEEYKNMILQFLQVQTEEVTCTDILKSVFSQYEGFSAQKVAALIKALIKEAKVKKEMVKGRAMISLA